jgi:hypothetical protein
MTRSFVLKAAGVVLAASVLLGGGLFGLRFDTAPQATAAPVPKIEMAKAEDVTDALAELLGQPAVQRELKLSAESRVNLIDGFDKLTEELEKAGVRKFAPGITGVEIPFPGGQAGGGPVVGADDAWQADLDGRRKLVAGTLTKAQFTRLQQCEVQTLGIESLHLKRVADELGLTDEQKQVVAKAVGELHTYPLSLPPEATQRPTQVERLTAVIEGFTPAQQKKWKELAGEKVGFDRSRVASRCPALFAQLASVAPDAGGPQPVPPVAPNFPPPGIGAQPPPPPANPGK